MKKPLIIVQGSMNYDFIVTSRKLPLPGETLIGLLNRIYSGGKGANQAVQLAKLGADVYLIGRLGRDEQGRFILDQLKSTGVKTDYINFDDSGTGIGCVQCDEQGNTYSVVVPNANGKNRAEDIINAAEIIKKADMALCQLETTDEATDCFMEMAKKSGVPLILNPAPAKKIDSLFFKRAFLITPNETEASFYTGIPAQEVASENGREQAAAILLDMGAPRVVITLGKKGSYYKDTGCFYYCKPYSVKAIDSTAAGDAFNGALCYALSMGKSIEEAMRFGNVAGAYAASRLGAQASMGDHADIGKIFDATNSL